MYFNILPLLLTACEAVNEKSDSGVVSDTAGGLDSGDTAVGTDAGSSIFSASTASVVINDDVSLPESSYFLETVKNILGNEGEDLVIAQRPKNETDSLLTGIYSDNLVDSEINFSDLPNFFWEISGGLYSTTTGASVANLGPDNPYLFLNASSANEENGVVSILGLGALEDFVSLPDVTSGDLGYNIFGTLDLQLIQAIPFNVTDENLKYLLVTSDPSRSGDETTDAFCLASFDGVVLDYSLENGADVCAGLEGTTYYIADTRSTESSREYDLINENKGIAIVDLQDDENSSLYWNLSMDDDGVGRILGEGFDTDSTSGKWNQVSFEGTILDSLYLGKNGDDASSQLALMSADQLILGGLTTDSFESSATISIEGGSWVSLSQDAGDVDGDGHSDFVAITDDGQAYLIYQNDLEGDWSLDDLVVDGRAISWEDFSTAPIDSATLGDWDGDGLANVALGSGAAAQVYIFSKF